MTRVYVYSSALVAFVAATGMIVASIFIPNWVSYSVTTPKGDVVEKHIGLHKTCSNLNSPTCREFPTAEFLVSFLVVMKGGKYKRETGWPLVAGMLTLVSVVEFAVISIVAYLFDHDEQFTIPGWNLDVSWYISTVSATIALLAAAGLAVSAYLLSPEGGYEFLEDPIDA
ncbi:hypothetical protein H634G_01187 [Metarhizium anisopliae BRIP 53293]|uniref:Pre-mRNA splicing factor n=1 Tax=Metarhizium anisopliae BRIP 53293 TaxID=1291518 RepID=A0A0D9PA18_METAN|nr:hypothetical protein H634G_01187 [Metarhizium anisopliae BRIP 53293]